MPIFSHSRITQMNCTVNGEIVGKGSRQCVYGVKICEQILTTDEYAILGWLKY